MDVTNVDDDDIAVYRPVGGKEDSQLLDRHAPLQFGNILVSLSDEHSLTYM